MNNNNHSIGKFYEVSRGAVQQVARHSNRATAVLAYLALKRYQQRSNTDVTSAGRMALSKVLGVSQRRAIYLMDELRSIAWGKHLKETALINAHDWNQACAESERVRLGHSGGGKGSNKVMPPCGNDFIYLPNSLTEKSPEKQYSPLGQLNHLSDKETRLNATMLLLALYEHLDMQHFGGTDPAATIYIPWRYDGESDGLSLGHLGFADGLHYWAVDFRASDRDYWSDNLTTAQWAFIESITGESKDNQEAPKFSNAWNALRDLGLVYHAAMVFDTDPLSDPDADVLYPLWTFNPAERERLNGRGYDEGGLAVLTANKASRDAVNEEHNEIMQSIWEEGGLVDKPTGWFIAAAPNKQAKVLGILRPRFIPNTGDGQAGWGSIRDKADTWAARLGR